jgi:shikimate dehydrogenase
MCDEAIPLFAVMGSPIAHSLSPELFAGFFEAAHIDARYIRISVADAAQALSAGKAFGLRAWNLTSPLKETTVPLLDGIDPMAAAIGSVNSIRIEDSRSRVGRTTDPEGILDSLRAHGARLDGAKCLVIGAGGAGKVAVHALIKAGATVRAVNRNVGKASATLPCEVAGFDSLATLARECDVIVSTLASTHLPDPESWLGPDCRAVVLDADYKNATLYGYAARMGHRAIEGREWLARQAMRAFEFFTGVDAPYGAERAIASIRSIERPPERRHGKAVVFGMMGAGKSACASALASSMGIPFVDIDRDVEARLGYPIAEIFARHGEARFREEESTAIERALGSPGASVIALGGGALESARNRAVLRDAAWRIWLHGPLPLLYSRASDGTRPLAIGGLPAFEALFQKRKSNYASMCDFAYDVGKETPSAVAKGIYAEIGAL